MRISRVSNAGVLLELDGVKILLDGFCTGHGPYLAPPAHIRESLLANPPDMLAFTHEHPDHFDALSAEYYHKQTLRPVLGPENLPCGTTSRGIAHGFVSILPIKSRHIGKEYFHVPHVSYAINGSKSVWFLGDAVPSQWHGIDRKCHVLIAPFAYANSKTSWELSCKLADKVVLLHLPERSNDPYGLWPAVDSTTTGATNLFIPQMGEIICI